MEETTAAPSEFLASDEVLIHESPKELEDPPSDDRQQSWESPPPVAMSSLPPFVNSLTELKTLSSAINSFNQCYEDLQIHLESIRSAIEVKLNAAVSNVTALPIPGEPVACLDGKGNFQDLQQEEEKTPNSKLEDLCKFMSSREIKKYMIKNLSNLDELREEVPKALKLAPYPPKLVLDCLGKFYLQGSKAYTKNSYMIPAREASVLMLECFLLMKACNHDNGALIIDRSVKEEAENAALGWRKRLVAEGGLARAKEIDARGLLLFLSCFGILDRLRREDIRDLVVASNAKDMLELLKKSTELMKKIPETIEWMIQNRKETDAVNLVYTFDLVEKFNPETILTSYLSRSKASGKRIRKEDQESAAAVFEANKRQLAALNSVVNCLEKHDIDPSKFLPEWEIRQNITILENEIANSDLKEVDKAVNKRKPGDFEKKMRTRESKRGRSFHHGQPQSSIGLANSMRNIPDNNSIATNVFTYPSVLYGGRPSGGLMPENIFPPGVGTDMSPKFGVNLPATSFAPVHGGILVDSSGQVVNQGGKMIDPSRQVVNHGAQPYSWRVDAKLIGGQSSSLGLTNLYGTSSTSAQTSPAILNASIVAPDQLRNSTSDLYQLPDSVTPIDPSRVNISHTSTSVSNVVPLPAHRSYLH